MSDPASASLIPPALRYLGLTAGESVPVTSRPLPAGSLIRTPAWATTPGPTTRNIMPRMNLNPLSTTARSATSSSPIATRGLRSGLLRGAGAGIAAELLGAPLGRAIGGSGPDEAGFDRADLGQATTGAGRGAALGYSVGGGYGALVGGVLGGVTGALDVFGDSGPLAAVGDIFGGGGEDKNSPYSASNTKKTLNQFLRGAGLDESTRGTLKKTAAAQLELATTDEERAAILNNTVGVVQQSALQQRQAQQQLANSLALQAQAARIFQPFAESNQRVANMAADVYGQMKQNLGPGLDAVADMFAINTQQQADLMTQGLYTTALARPRIDALVAQQQQIDSIAAQIVQQASATAASGGGGGSGVDIEALMASVG